jgi:hypothetical protein
VSKHKCKAFVFMAYEYKPDYSDKEWVPQVWHCRVDDSDERVFISEQVLEIDIPDDFDPIPKQVAAIEEAKRQALETYQRSVAELNERLSKLLALTHEVSA